MRKSKIDRSAASDGPAHVGSIVVVGSLNMDLVVRAPYSPKPGETLVGHSFSQVPGGKGANQAVAAARLGAQVAMIGCIGEDSYGTTLRQELENNAIDCHALAVDKDLSTGMALIVVDDTGQNSIVVVSGSNGALTPTIIAQYEAIIAKADLLVCQREIPNDTVLEAMQIAHRHHRVVVLNPAPVSAPLSGDWFKHVDFLIPNELEASVLTGIRVNSRESAEHAAKKLHQLGARNVIITLGSQGVFALISEARGQHYPSQPVKAVDTTAAGDTFIGGFCAKLVSNSSIEEAICFGQAAAAISVTRPGAQPSIPYLHDL